MQENAIQIQVLIKTPSLLSHYKKYSYTYNVEQNISEVKQQFYMGIM